MRGIKSGVISFVAIGLLAGSAVGVAAQDEEAAAEVTSFHGSIFHAPAPDVEPTEVALPNGFTESTGYTYRNNWRSTEERFMGEVTGVSNWVIDPNLWEPFETGGQPNMLIRSVSELTTDGGSWLGEGTTIISTDLDVATETIIFIGRDGYEGLTASVIIDHTGDSPTFSGVIFPTAMPEMPEPYPAE